MHAAADLLPLPCDAGYEQFRLLTQGALSTGTIRTISPSSVVSYASTNTAAAVRQGSDLVVAADGRLRRRGRLWQHHGRV